MARSKVTVTETVTAELVPGPPPVPPPPREPSARGGADRARGSEVDAVTQVLGVTPAISLGEQMLALTTSLGIAAHNATAFQHNNVVVSEASTAAAVRQLFTTPVPVRAKATTPARSGAPAAAPSSATPRRRA
jgi:hypothetical protein